MREKIPRKLQIDTRKMADMEETGQTTTGFEEDPAAAFLAREQDELADIAGETLGVGAGDSETGQAPPMIQTEQDMGDFLGGDMGQEEQVAPLDPYAAVSQMDTFTSEPECIRKWREEQQEILAKKDAEEAAALDELRALARKELADWYSRHDDQVGQTKVSNRQAEEVFIDERDEDVPGHEWERVACLCDFNPKNSKTTKDISRMRTIFLQLKQTPLVRE